MPAVLAEIMRVRLEPRADPIRFAAVDESNRLSRSDGNAMFGPSQEVHQGDPGRSSVDQMIRRLLGVRIEPGSRASMTNAVTSRFSTAFIT